MSPKGNFYDVSATKAIFRVEKNKYIQEDNTKSQCNVRRELNLCIDIFKLSLLRPNKNIKLKKKLLSEKYICNKKKDLIFRLTD